MATYFSPYCYSSFQPAEISYFSGEGVDQWLYQVEGFFSRYQTVPKQKFVVVVHYLSGEAMEWYRQMWMGRRLSTWDNFVVDLRHRFKPPEIQQSRAELLGSIWNVCEMMSEMMSEMMKAGHFSESRNNLYRNLRLDCPASKQFVGKDKDILVLHKLVDDIFKYYEEGGSLGDHEFAFSTVWALAADHVACLIDTTFIECLGPLQLMSEFIGAPNHMSMTNLGSFYYGMRFDSGQSCDLDPDTRVSSLCRDFHLDKLTATRDATIMVHKDVKQLTILRVWAFCDQITLKENSEEDFNENNTIINLFGLLSIHMPVYLGSIIEEVSTVMVPYSEWHGKKMFENQNLLTGVLKNKLKSQVRLSESSFYLDSFCLGEIEM